MWCAAALAAMRRTLQCAEPEDATWVTWADMAAALTTTPRSITPAMLAFYAAYQARGDTDRT